MKTKIFYDFEATSVSRDADMISVGLVAVTTKDVKLTGNIKDDKFEVEYKEQIKTIYCEFTDFNIDKCDDWVKENVVGKLKVKPRKEYDGYVSIKNNNTEIFGNTQQIKISLKQWLSQFEEIEFWADFDVIDKPMLIDLITDWDTAIDTKLYQKCDREFDCCDFDINWFSKTFDKVKIGLPKHLPNIQYDQFFDLHTLFKIKGIDTDISRERFVNSTPEEWLKYADNCNELGFTVANGMTKHNALYDACVSWLCYIKLMK